MAVLTWLGFVFFLGYTHCYYNLSGKPSTIVTQSSTYGNHSATLAKDGIKQTTEKYCSHTGLNRTKAWLQVDLGKKYSISYVKIFYRNEGINGWKQYRFRQFYMDVSNLSAAPTTTTQRTRCYTDNTLFPELPPNIINMTCKHTARFVIVETTYDAEEDNKDGEHGAILEICEIEVYGCEVGRYGAGCMPCLGCSTCDIDFGCQCSAHCMNNSCDDSQHCIQGCKSGHWGKTCEAACSSNCVNNLCSGSNGRCTEVCVAGYWGHNCSSLCPQNCNEPTCSRDDGRCVSCKSNWAGNQCDRCDHTHYGKDCSFSCSINCTNNTCNNTGYCTEGCKVGNYGKMCQKQCSTCKADCDRISGECNGECPDGKFGAYCEKRCDQLCIKGCMKINGICFSCDDKKYGDYCNKTCSLQCQSACDQQSGSCDCISGWTGTTCNEALTADEFPVTTVGAGVGGLLFVVIAVLIIVFVLIRRKRHKKSKSASSVLYHKSAFNQDESKGYTNLGSITVAIEDPDEEPQIEKPEECVYYNNLSVAKDISVSDLLNIITTKQAKENEGFLKEFKSLPYGERFPCEVAKSAENVPKNRFKTTFPYDHSRVVLESSKEFNSDYINANYIENMDGKREFIASQGPRVNTVVDHWRMIWQEHVNYIVMLTNLIEGPKVRNVTCLNTSLLHLNAK